MDPISYSGIGLIAAEKKHPLLLELSPQLLYVTDVHGNFERVSPSFEGALGYTHDELRSRPFLDFVHPDDQSRAGAEIRKLRNGVPTVTIESRFRGKDGDYRIFSSTAVLDSERGLVFAAAMDVTSGFRTEPLFRRLLEFSPDAMVIVNGAARIVLVNALAEQLFGHSREEMLGQPLEMLLPKAMRGQHGFLLQRYMADPRPRAMGAGRELCGLCRNGRVFPAEISLGPLQTPQGILVVSAIRDITERKRAEEQIRNQQAQLIAAQTVQKGLLPSKPPAIDSYDIYGVCHPAQYAGGDHFDYMSLPQGKTCFVVSDVVGHGIGAALLMAATKSHLHSASDGNAQLDEIVARVNRFLADQTSGDVFVTTLLVRLDPRSGTADFVNAGHPPGLVFGSAGELKLELSATAQPLGIDSGATFRIGSPFALVPGDLLVLYSDGLTEAACGEVQYGTSRLIESVRRHRDKNAKQITKAVYEDVLQFADEGPQDDVTIVVIKALAS